MTDGPTQDFRQPAPLIRLEDHVSAYLVRDVIKELSAILDRQPPSGHVKIPLGEFLPVYRMVADYLFRIDRAIVDHD